MDTSFDDERIHALVRRVFFIEDIVTGTASSRDKLIYKYHGRLMLEDTARAYDQLAADLKPFNITPLFRLEGDRQAVLLVPGVPQLGQSNPRVNLIMFILTVISVLVTGALYNTTEPLPSRIGPAIWAIISTGLPFTISLLAILGAHEFGHYLMGRHHGVNVTLPYFIPLPLVSPVGTMGAFINMKEPPKNRRILLDIGIAGPLAGLIVAIPVLLIGLSLSTVSPLPSGVEDGGMLTIEGNSVLYLASKFLVFGRLLPAPASYGDVSPLLYWLRYFFTARPVPLGGMDVILHPVAWAGWFGILVTALNLIPAGQLDGGHMMYVLFGRKFAERSLPFILIAVVLLGFLWNGWWLWAALIFLLGRSYAEPLDQITPLDNRRRVLAVIALILFLLVFTPVPLSLFG